MSAQARINPQQRFSVRDISTRHGSPAFDLLFQDLENGVERCSEGIWESAAQAEVEADRLEQLMLRPVHWDIDQH